MYEYIIIGGGVTGITVCKKLLEKGIDNILLLEAEGALGGLCKSQNIDGHVLDLGGGHFFHTKHEEIFEYIFAHIPQDKFHYYARVSKIELGQNTIDYPVESNVWQLPLNEQIDYLISIIRNGEALGKKEPHNYEEWIRWKLGDRICENYMLPYNRKLWGVEPSEMDIDWLYKIPQVNVKEVLQYSLEKKADENKFPAHIHFYYPKEGGFGIIVDALSEGIMSKVALNEPVKSMKYKEHNWIINNQYQAHNVVNTTPWNDLQKTMEVPSSLENDFSKIQYNRIVVSLYEQDYTHNWHWRYVPDINKRYHREFYIHNFAPASRENGVYLETNIKRWKKGGVSGKGRLIGEYETKAAYPIPLVGSAGAIQNILQYFEKRHLYGVGRWGQHQYQNADVSMYEAIKFVEKQCETMCHD